MNSLQYGEEAVKEGVGAGGMPGGMDMFSELFGGGGRRPRGPRKGEDVVHRLTVSLKDFYMGTSKCGILTVPCLQLVCVSSSPVLGLFDAIGVYGISAVGNLPSSLHYIVTGDSYYTAYHLDALLCVVSAAYRMLLTLSSLHCRKLSLKRPAKCDLCSGSGTKSGNKSTCENCQGTGIETVMRQVGPGMITQMQRKCSRCKGAGKSIRPGMY